MVWEEFLSQGGVGGREFRCPETIVNIG